MLDAIQTTKKDTMKIVDFLRREPPSNAIHSFPDSVSVIDIDGNTIYTTPFGRSTPNAFKPNLTSETKTNAWDAWYACVALGVYNGEVIEHEHHGKCIRLLGEIETILPNPNQHNWHVALGILVHKSDTNTWPGSAGCLTVRSSEWKGFISHFKVKERVKIQVRGIH